MAREYRSCMNRIVTVSVSSSRRTKQQSIRIYGTALSSWRTLRCGGLSRRPAAHSAHQERNGKWVASWMALPAAVGSRGSRSGFAARHVPLHTPPSMLLLDVTCSSGLTGHKTRRDASLTSTALENLQRSLQPAFVRRRFLPFSQTSTSVQS